MPGHCICPNENYSCVVNSAIDIAWRTNTTVRDDFELSVTAGDAKRHSEVGGFQVTLSRSSDLEFSNFTSTLHVRDLKLNESNITCECTHVAESGFERVTTTTTVCVIGN